MQGHRMPTLSEEDDNRPPRLQKPPEKPVEVGLGWSSIQDENNPPPPPSTGEVNDDGRKELADDRPWWESAQNEIERSSRPSLSKPVEDPPWWASSLLENDRPPIAAAKAAESDQLPPLAPAETVENVRLPTLAPTETVENDRLPPLAPTEPEEMNRQPRSARFDDVVPPLPSSASEPDAGPKREAVADKNAPINPIFLDKVESDVVEDVRVENRPRKSRFDDDGADERIGSRPRRSRFDDDGVDERPRRRRRWRTRRREPEGPSFPVLLKIAAGMWLIYGVGVVCLAFLVFLAAALTDNKHGGLLALLALFGGLFGAAFILVGFLTITGQANGTIGNGLGSLAFAAYMTMSGFQQPASAAICFFIAISMLLAGVFALLSSDAYHEWQTNDSARNY
jgi:hypothetical protein